jgi:hypothetical protein
LLMDNIIAPATWLNTVQWANVYFRLILKLYNVYFQLEIMSIAWEEDYQDWRMFSDIEDTGVAI